MSPETTNIQGDQIGVGNITNAKGIAIGRGASVNIQEGLTVEDVAILMVELKNKDQPDVWDGRFPYLGLTAFQESDSQFFFGRESLVKELLERVKEARFIVIAGPSGSGKSSVARAGLFHALRDGGLDKSDGWLLGTMQPKGDPIEQLAAAIDRMVKRPGAGDYVRENGRFNSLALHEQIDPLLSDDPRQRCVLLVDQFEETFTQTKEEDRAAFIGLLTEAAKVKNGRLTIIISLRADFVSHCARYAELRKLMSQQFQLVGAMDAPDLAKAITLPALEVGAEIDPKLVSRIMADMKGEPGALPLMSFALRDLFEAEKSIKGKPIDLTLPEYLKRGGIESALERHANSVFDTFTKEQKGLARGVFSKLIEVGQGRADTRRTAVFSELIPAGVEDGEITAVVDALAQEGVRLITTSGSGGTVTIAHEKLIDAWPWLRQLVDENREMIVLQNQINDDAKSWAEKEDSGYLYRGGRLIQVEEQLQASTPDLNELSQEFIQASLAQRQNEIEEKEAQQRREIEQAQELAEEQRQRAEAEQKRSSLFRKALIGGGILLLFLMAAMIFAWMQTNNANKSLAIANTSGTAEAHALSTSEADSNIRATAVVEAEISESHANESLNIANVRGTAEANALATSEAEAEARAIAVVEAENANAEAIVEKNNAIVSLGQAEVARNDAISQTNISRSYIVANESLNYAGDDPMLPFLLAIGSGQYSDTALAYQAINQWFPNMGIKLHSDSINSIDWNGNEDYILTTGDDGNVLVWDVHEKRIVKQLEHNGAVWDAQWNEGETKILTVSDDDVVRIWNSQDGSKELELVHSGKVNSAEWNNSGEQVLTSSDDGNVRVWNANTGDLIYILELQSSVNSAQWDSEFQSILTAENDGSIKIWNPINEELSHSYQSENSILIASWSPDSSSFLTVDSEGEVGIWRLLNNQWQYTPIFYGETISDVIWNHAGNMVLVAGGDGFAMAFSIPDMNVVLVAQTESIILKSEWSSNDKQILAVMENGGIEVWDIDNGQLITPLSLNESFITFAKWNRSSDQIMLGTVDGSIRNYHIKMEDLIKEACSVTTRRLTYYEREQYLPESAYVEICDSAETASIFPDMYIVDVACKSSVTITTFNYPTNQDFIIKMGKYGTQGLGGFIVGVANSGSGGTFTLTLPIPEELAEDDLLDLGFESTDHNISNWFYNNASPNCN